MVACQNNENPTVCAECGGKCCKWMPGPYSPEQFGAPDAQAIEERLFKTLLEGTAQIDWWEGDPRSYEEKECLDDDDLLDRVNYIRPPVMKAHGSFRHGAWSNEICSLLTPTGCKLSFEQRPIVCQLAIPNPDKMGECLPAGEEPEDYNEKQDFSIRWLPYQDAIDKAETRAEKERYARSLA